MSDGTTDEQTAETADETLLRRVCGVARRAGGCMYDKCGRDVRVRKKCKPVSKLVRKKKTCESVQDLCYNYKK